MGRSSFGQTKLAASGRSMQGSTPLPPVAPPPWPWPPPPPVPAPLPPPPLLPNPASLHRRGIARMSHPVSAPAASSIVTATGIIGGRRKKSKARGGRRCSSDRILAILLLSFRGLGPLPERPRQRVAKVSPPIFSRAPDACG